MASSFKMNLNKEKKAELKDFSLLAFLFMLADMKFN